MNDPGKLLWRCRRGTLELDLLLGRYLDNGYKFADENEKLAFDELLKLEDTQLLPYLIGDKKPESAHQVNLVNKIRTLSATGRGTKP